jgi:DNA-binding transcriptional regulator YdaS (Cro superfamily)
MPSDQLRAVKSYQRVISLLGGTAEAARALKTSPTQICQWRTRKNAFPAEQFYVVQKALRRRGYRAEPQAFTFLPVE